MCIRYSHHDLVFAIIEMEDSISSAALLADKLETYVFNVTEAYSEDRILYELNEINRKISEASNQNAKMRKEINDARRRRKDASAQAREPQAPGHGGLRH